MSRRISPKTVRNIVGVLKSDSRRAVWRDWKLTFPEEQDPDKEQRYFTQAEMIQIVNAAEGQWKVLFALGGNRVTKAGEAFGLEIEDLDLAAGLIRVRRSIWNGKSGDGEDETGKRPVNVLNQLSRRCWLVTLEIERSGRVFQTRTGQHFRRATFDVS